MQIINFFSMSILIHEHSRMIIQGITGKEGSRAADFMIRFGSYLIGGVTPGKQGQEVFEKPVFDTVASLQKSLGSIDASFIAVPPKFAKSAMLESIEARIPLIVVGTENIPIHDVAYGIEKSRKAGVRIVGPSSVGIISPGLSKIGFIGGITNKGFQRGNIGIISKSGGMCAETALLLHNVGLGQSTVVGMGGDVLAGSDFVDILELFEKDADTKGVVIFGEIGGTYEEKVADMVMKKRFTKPLAAFISGIFVENLESSGLKDKSIGHAGAIIEGDKGKRSSKIQALRNAGITVVDVHHELGNAIKQLL